MDITPVILAFNESSNLRRTLEGLTWAKTVVVVDSGSTDDTLAIARSFANVAIHSRPFDSHASQWNFALAQATTEWCLTLDADYVVSPEGAAEMRARVATGDADGYFADLRFCVHGHPLYRSILPPRLVLFRRALGEYVQDGHTQLLAFRGREAKLAQPILHDDRKDLGRWLWAQNRYANLEVEKLRATPMRELGWADRVRRAVVIAPVLVPSYYLFARGGVADGWAGLHYAAQRSIAELVLSIKLIEQALAKRGATTTESTTTKARPNP